jgi:hypothetical protein
MSLAFRMTQISSSEDFAISGVETFGSSSKYYLEIYRKFKLKYLKMLGMSNFYFS